MMRRLTEATYFTAVETDPKVLLRCVPRPAITGMIATAIPAAIRPYSMAVAPDSSARKALSFVLTKLAHSRYVPWYKY
jgi:hypothetical protein